MIEDKDVIVEESAGNQLDFEKYKAKIELFKWLIGSVALVLVTTVIDFGFRDRSAGLTEIQQYDKYVTELIVLNEDPGQKRMLAQFFSNVTPSEKLKAGWTNYFNQVDKEYKDYIEPILKNDSIIRKEYYSYAGKKTLTQEEIEKKQILELQIEENKRLINPAIILPGQSPKNFNSALEWEKKGFSFLLEKDVENSIAAFSNSEKSYNSFHQVYEISNYLNKNKSQLLTKDSAFWKTAFKTILDNYSWKMPQNVKQQIIGEINT